MQRRLYYPCHLFVHEVERDTFLSLPAVMSSAQLPHRLSHAPCLHLRPDAVAEQSS
jgi:hypothetical protein